MTSANETTTTAANSLALTAEKPLHLDSADPVLAIANTPNHFSSQACRYPAWFHDLIRHLRQYRPWRFLIKSDNTIDLEYLTALALQAQQRACRPDSPTQQAQQLSLFPNPLSDELVPVTINSIRSEQPVMQSFTVITGANLRDNQNTITLPDEILTINAGEQLHEYLRRVADAAVAATIQVSGSHQAALARLGSKAHARMPARPVLSLAPTPSPSKTRDRIGRR
jgi:hypothetical protein